MKKAENVNSKVIREAVGVIECSLETIIPIGDHDLFVGRFETAYAKEDFKGYWMFEEYLPILYSGSVPSGTKHRFSHISRDFVEIPYKSDRARDELIQNTLDILRRETGQHQLDRSRAVKLIAEKLKLQKEDSKYLVDQLLTKKKIHFGNGSKTSY